MSLFPRRSQSLSAALVVALVGSLLVLGATLTPASSHVTGNIKHLWAKHIKPMADKRYYTKKASNNRFLTPAQADARYLASSTGFGDSLSGIWGASGVVDQRHTVVIEFNPPLPGDVVGSLLQPGGTSANCPGAGQAQPGHLCVYTHWNNSMTIQGSGFLVPNSSLTGVARNGTVFNMASSSSAGNVRGTWTVTAPLQGARPAPPQRPATPRPDSG